MTSQNPNWWGLYYGDALEPINEVVIMEACPVPKVIAIDPGHGDKHNDNSKFDPGAVSKCNQYLEKEIAFEIANTVRNILENTGREDTIIMTKDTVNVTINGGPLQWRIDKAKTADIFVSIHGNANDKIEPNGFKVYYKIGNEKSKSLARSIQNANTLFLDKGIAEGNFYVLNKFNGIAVLVEAGFISNKSDLEIMTTKQEQIGREIAAGIINYLEVN